MAKIDLDYHPHFNMCDAILRHINEPDIPTKELTPEFLAEPDSQKKGALSNLKDDGYIFWDGESLKCSITTKGRSFCNNGGYEVWLAKEKDRQKWKDGKDYFDLYFGRPIALILFAIAIVTFVINSLKSCHSKCDAACLKANNNDSCHNKIKKY